MGETSSECRKTEQENRTFIHIDGKDLIGFSVSDEKISEGAQRDCGGSAEGAQRERGGTDPIVSDESRPRTERCQMHEMPFLFRIIFQV